jgi:hypothetical protein
MSVDPHGVGEKPEGGSPMFTLARFLPRALPLLVVVAMMPAPIPAAAWANVPSLSNEALNGSGTLNVSNCGALSGTFGFNVTSGAATGSYPGTFSENGSVTITGINATGFTANFAITATSGPQSGDTVAGTKTWAAPAGNFALCAEGIALNVHATYRATITRPGGERFCDNGTAVSQFGTNGLGSVSETFTSNLAAATPLPLSGTCP